MYDSGLDACTRDLYTDETELRQKYPDAIADKVMRCRAMHQWILANPSAKDAHFITEEVARFKVTRPTAYSDLAIIKSLLPHLDTSTREFHKWRFNEMILQTFDIAQKRKDARTMEKAAATYAKYNTVDREDEFKIPIEQILPQPFIATDDPTVLGIKPIPNLRQRQRQLIEKYAKETTDIQDIQFEEIDLQESELFDEA